MIDHYDHRGRLLDEPDETPLELRRHCIRCGAFLPKKPQEVKREVPTKVDYVYSSDGSADVVVLETETEVDAELRCSRCGHEHEGDEMWV